MSRYYMFSPDTKEITYTKDADKVAEWFKDVHNRVVDQQTVDELNVSTVALGLDHNFTGSGDPLIFETMVFYQGKATFYQERYSTYEEALEGHKQIVDRLSSNQAFRAKLKKIDL